MLRIWKGPEMEGNDVGIPTMFICSDKPVERKRVIECLYKNPDVRRLYFGAGRTPFYGMDDWKGLYDYAFQHSIDIVVEVDAAHLKEFIRQYDNMITTFVVVNYEMPFTYNNLQFKTDDTEVVKIFTVSSRTMLDTLKDNNLFVCDKMLVEEE